jgi:putative FmdB family regulatory protein
MPTYAYRCAVCGKVFDELVYEQGERVTCPGCSSEQVHRSVTAPACCTSDRQSSPVGCGCDTPGTGGGGCCGGSSCSLG